MKGLSSKSAILLLLFAFGCNPTQRGTVIACLGDSITESSYPRHLARALAEEGFRSKILNYGKSGYTSGEFLSFLRENQEVLAGEHPDWILIQLGTNDVRMDHDRTSLDQFAANMRNILDIISRMQNPDGKNSRILLATIPPIPTGAAFPFSAESRRRVEEEINPELTRISQEKKIPLVDNHSLFVENPHLLPDVHPTEEGYRLLAFNWLAALKPLLD